MKIYYVYHLIDPRDGKVFYVGKGKGNRAYQHQKEVSRNPSKYAKTEKGCLIKEILDSGNDVKIEFVETNLEEIEALILEANEIQSIGIENLKNVNSIGAISGKERRPGFSDGMFLVSSWMKVADARLVSVYGPMLTEVHSELSQAMETAIMSSRSEMFIDGMSEAIGRGYTGFGCKIDIRKAHWRPERL